MKASHPSNTDDNVDHNLGKINGLGTFHDMGIMVAITPETNAPPKSIPRAAVDPNDIIEVGNIERYYYYYQGKYLALNVNMSNTKGNIIDVFWQCSWLLKCERPSWNGYILMISKGTHPGESTLSFITMIEMKATNESCI